MATSMIVFDRNTMNDVQAPFWLRVAVSEHETQIVELGAHSLPEAYRKSLALGHDPATWASIEGKHTREMSIPSGLNHMRETAGYPPR